MNGPRETGGHTALGQVLAAFAARGGQLSGARRRIESPLTLTHVRWMGADGATIEAARIPEADASLSPEEREVWLQLALDYPVSQGPMTPDASTAWMPLTTPPARASELMRLLHTSRSTTWGHPHSPLPISGTPYSAGYQPSPMGSYPESGGFGPSTGPIGMPAPVSMRPAGFGTPTSGGASMSSSQPANPYAVPGSEAHHLGNLGRLPPMEDDTALINTPAAWTNSWQTNSWNATPEGPEVTVIACVEIEMPTILASQGGNDYTRDFSREVASSFKRVCHTLPQARETRGWMRGNFLILAARMAVGNGNRAPSSLEIEAATQTLAEALARQTVPYNRLTLANPGEWAQGVALPN